MRKIYLLFLFVNTLNFIHATTYYVSPTGNDNNPGTLSQPWKTWDKAFASRAPGDIVYFRGGVYYMTVLDGGGYSRQAVGTASDSILFLNYPGETPILDCSTVKSISGDNNNALTLRLTYSRVRGLVLRNVWQSGSSKEVQAWAIFGNHAVIDNCVVYNTHGRGFWAINSDELTFRNCDSYNNSDDLTSVLPGNDGYGFFIQDLESTTRKVYVRQCRAWRCGDDGFTCYSNAYVEFDRCWSLYNGKLQGEGHGFKLGWLEVESSLLRRVVKNCLAAWNKSDGINTNDDPGSTPAAVMNIYNNTCYHNTTSSVGGDAYGFIIFNSGSSDAIEKSRVFKNNIAYKNYAGNILATSNALYTDANNNWNLGVTLTDDDFISTDTTGLLSPRSPGGSLPNIRGFMQLKSTSDLIDKGTNVGLAYSGKAPDLGYMEYTSAVTPVIPAYQSSVIENATPATLEAVFSVSLSSPAPSPSAFSVKVNSQTRTVNAVSISGAKVRLTLSSAVVYTDVVTVSYTKPAQNPLQGSDGGQVETFANKTVTNNTVQSHIAVTSISVAGQGNNTTITTSGGTLQMTASVLPSNATNKTVTWSVTNGTGKAVISATGLLTAQSNGIVTVKAFANDGSGISGTLQITLSNQTILVSSITVSMASGSASSDKSIQFVASLLPANASNKEVTWSTVNGTGNASINTTGLLTVASVGTVTVKATAKDGSGVSGSLQINLTNLAVKVTSIIVSVAPGFSESDSIIQLSAAVLPNNASVKNVSWSIINGTGKATITSDGLLAQELNGSVTVKATATDGSSVFGTLDLLLSKPDSEIHVNSITVIPYGNAKPVISNRYGKLKMQALIEPSDASNKLVTWSVVNITGGASISGNGVLTANKNGSVQVFATSDDNSEASGSCMITITNQSPRFRAYLSGSRLIVTGDYATDVTENSEEVLEATAQAAKLDNPFTYRIYNMEGYIVYNYSTPETTVEVDVSGYLPGIYIISVYGTEEDESIKILIP